MVESRAHICSAFVFAVSTRLDDDVLVEVTAEWELMESTSCYTPRAQNQEKIKGF